MRAYEIVTPDGIDALSVADRDASEPGPGQICVAVRASSINYRDLATAKNPVPRGISYPRVPNSDAAGEITAVGPGVSQWKTGDAVASCFFQAWQDGPVTTTAMASALGGAIDGVLAEQVILSENGVVAIPDHMSFEQAATLPCAALTAWRALIESGGLKAGETILLLGTGGVSIFALQIAVMHGAKVIITSGSDEKLTRAHQLGAAVGVNYRTNPDWEKVVLDLTDGCGVDHVVEVGGAGTLEKSIQAVRVGGHIALIGVLTSARVDPVSIMRKSLRLHGIYVGSRRVFQDMNRAFTLHKLEPVIDRVFPFDRARDAFHYMEAARHFGKIVVSVP